MLPAAKKFATLALALAGAFALPTDSFGKKKDKDRDRDDDDDHRHHHGSSSWYHSQPRSTFSLSFGSGYAGRGYYYGPPGASYYYRQPGVTYYRSRDSYHGSPSYRSGSLDYSVQRELARRGYYRGPLDGDIGPMSRSAIARYQRDRGLSVTGSITSSLLRSLGLS